MNQALDKLKELEQYSDPIAVQKKAYKYLGKNAVVYLSSKKNKKYMLFDPETNKYVHFGQMGYEDFTRHKNLLKRNKYLARSLNIKGNWKDNKYSPNNLSIHLLW